MKFSHIDYDNPLDPKAVFLPDNPHHNREFETGISIVVIHNIIEDRKFSESPHFSDALGTFTPAEFLHIILPDYIHPSRSQRTLEVLGKKRDLPADFMTGLSVKIESGICDLTSIFNSRRSHQQHSVEHDGKVIDLYGNAVTPEIIHLTDYGIGIFNMSLMGDALQDYPTHLLKQAYDQYLTEQKPIPGLELFRKLLLG